MNVFEILAKPHIQTVRNAQDSHALDNKRDACHIIWLERDSTSPRPNQKTCSAFDGGHD